MYDTVAPEIRLLGQNAAIQVAGAAAVKQMDARLAADADDRPVYHFTFLIDQAVADKPAGLLLIRLQQKLRDDLLALHDPHYPMITILDGADWESRAVARSD